MVGQTMFSIQRTIYCRHCGYCLFGLPTCRCPECGKPFDPNRPHTYRNRPLRVWPRRLLFWLGIPLIVVAMSYGGMLAWLYSGWAPEQLAAAAASSPRDKLVRESALPPTLRPLLLPQVRKWQDRLVEIRLSNHPIDPEQFGAFTKCSHLRVLELRGLNVSPAQVALLSQIKSLEELDLVTHELRDGQLRPLCELPHLRSLTLFGGGRLPSDGLTGASVEELVKCKELRTLYLYGPVMSRTSLERLTALSELEELGFDSEDARDEGFPCLAKLRKLRTLSLSDESLKDDGLKFLATVPALTDLSLMGCDGLTGRAVDQLTGCRGLRRLDCALTFSISRQALRRLQQANPQCRIIDGDGHVLRPLPSTTPTP